MKVPFVMGHCGWDKVTLLPAGHIPAEYEIAAALRIMGAPFHGGLEVGFLARMEQPNALRLRMVDSTERAWISMCGGMTQVIGKALVETSFRDRFGCDFNTPQAAIDLHTDSGVIPIEVAIDGGSAARINSVMDRYAAYLYRLGVRRITLDGVEALDTGDFLVIDVEALERRWRWPGLDFTRRDSGLHLERVNQLLRLWQVERGTPGGVLGMLYDARAEIPGRFRVFPRFLGTDDSAAQIPYEFQCGTGTIAVAVALAERGLLAGSGEVQLEWGSRVTPDPYGIRTSSVRYAIEDSRLIAASFDHSVVEILADGELTIQEI